MIYDFALIAVIVGAGYWGVFFVRQQPHGTATFGFMQIAAAVLAGLGMLGRKVDAPWLGVAGAIGLGAGACLLVVGPLVRLLARRLVAAEQIGAARRLLDLAELLAPGSGVAEEKAVLRAMTEIREGRIEQTVDALTAAKDRAPAAARLAIDERIAMLYVAAYRWRDAIEHAETHLFEAPPPDDGDGSLRRALGVAPPVWVELVGAYGRVGDLPRAARMVARLEDVCTGRDDASLWIHRARTMFLALSGRIDAVRALLAPRQARHMSAATRSYWLAVAHEHHGDRAAATQAYERARARTRGRPRALIDQALAKLAEVDHLAPPALDGATSEVIARLEAAPLPPRIRARRSRGPRATWLLAAALVAVSVVTQAVLGETQDLAVMMRAGAMVHGAVDGGEWWRLVSCLFVHVGPVHLVFNAVALIVLGRLAEELFGSARMVAVFGGAGVAGALASFLASAGGVSGGASGAVFGLLGATFVELTWHRRRYRAAWKRGLWGGLAVVAVGQLAFGFFYPLIDQWAHGGGLFAGALLGAVLSPGARWTVAGGTLARVFAAAFVAVAVASGVLVARTSLADTFAAGERAQFVVDGSRITAPARWGATATDLYQPDGVVIASLRHAPPVDPGQLTDRWDDDVRRLFKDDLGDLARARAPIVALPAGWQGYELEAAPEDAMGYRQRWRVIVCGRAFADRTVVMAIRVPEGVAAAVPAFLAQLIASTGPA